MKKSKNTWNIHWLFPLKSNKKDQKTDINNTSSNLKYLENLFKSMMNYRSNMKNWKTTWKYNLKRFITKLKLIKTKKILWRRLTKQNHQNLTWLNPTRDNKDIPKCDRRRKSYFIFNFLTASSICAKVFCRVPLRNYYRMFNAFIKIRMRLYGCK